jgi:hypothetical protein
MQKPDTASPSDPGRDDYAESFCRNLGLVTAEEQQKLRNSRVAVAGLGGVGGVALLTFARMGIGKFSLADFDRFGLANMNRQAGAACSTIGRPKLDVMAERVRDINPTADLRLFPQGVRADNVDAFLADVDVVLDSVDFFSIDARTLIHQRARALGKTVLFSAPLGFSATLHVFPPEGMSFERYFDVREGMSKFERLIAFAVGLAPRGTHWAYMDLKKVSIAERAGPSLAGACDLSAGLVATEALARLLNRRPSRGVPCFTQFDPYRRKFVEGRLWFANRGPLQRLKRWFLARKFRDQAALLD